MLLRATATTPSASPPPLLEQRRGEQHFSFPPYFHGRSRASLRFATLAHPCAAEGGGVADGVVCVKRMKLSIIIPILNEAPQLRETLEPLRALQARGHEIIIVDGGSSDSSTAIAHQFTDHVIDSARGRARQMNAGAAVARGDVLLFLHADTRLPEPAHLLIVGALRNDKNLWGRFDVRLSGSQVLLRVVEALMNRRSRMSSIATGDQAIFVRRAVFNQVGGYPDIPLMEDIALCKLLKRMARPVNLSARVVTSSRRWEQHGIIRTILLMWRMRLAYALGASPHRLALLYRQKSPCDSRPPTF